MKPKKGLVHTSRPAFASKTEPEAAKPEPTEEFRCSVNKSGRFVFRKKKRSGFVRRLWQTLCRAAASLIKLVSLCANLLAWVHIFRFELHNGEPERPKLFGVDVVDVVAVLNAGAVILWWFGLITCHSFWTPPIEPLSELLPQRKANLWLFFF